MKIPPTAILLVLVCATCAVAQPAKPMKIRITDGTQVLTATLEDSAPAADFASMLPLSLTLEDYAAKEKIAYLPRKLVTTGAPAGIDPDVADIAYYAPWGNLAIYYRDAGFDKGLVRLGRLDGGVAALQRLARTGVRIERID